MAEEAPAAPPTETTTLLMMDTTSPFPEINYSLTNKNMLAGGLIAFEIVFLGLFWGVTTYDTDTAFDNKDYTVYRDIMVMILIGFGFLMAFLKQYGLGAVGFTMLIAVLCMQGDIFYEPMFQSIYNSIMGVTTGDDVVPFPYAVGMPQLINAEFCAAATLISFGAVIGQLTPLQILIFTQAESLSYAFNKIFLLFGWIGVEDIGGTLYIHLFGASFGLALSFVIGKPMDDAAQKSFGPNRVSDVLALLGTTALWVFWPSFVAASVWHENDYEVRCYINTVLALVASTGTAFCASAFFEHEGKFDPAEIANAVLAGGVAIGVNGRIDIGPGGAMTVGFLSGLVSILGFKFVSPILYTNFNIQDNCKIANLHGWPAVLGAIMSAIFVLFDGTSPFFQHGPVSQCIRQLIGIGSTIVVGGVTGYLTGRTIHPLKDMMTPSYEDGLWWEGNYFFHPKEE